MTESIKNTEKAQTMGQIVFSQFMTHKMSVLSAVVIVIFLMIALGADVIQNFSGLDPDAQNVGERYLAPMSVAEIGLDKKEIKVEFFTSTHKELANQIQQSLKEKNLVSVNAEDAILDLMNLPSDQAIEKLQQTQIPDVSQLIKVFNDFKIRHLLGTDELGRDVLIRLIYGTRVSMGVGILVAVTSALLGLIIGSIAGFYGGLTDTLLMRITDALLSLPTIPVLIIMAAVDLSKLPALKHLISASNESIYKMVIILCIFSWMQVARLVRGSILTLREREFVLAAKALGAKDSTIIIRHMFPNVIAPILVSISLGVGESILYEAALSFLGLGIMPPTPSWGNMLNNAQQLIYEAPFLAIVPGILILITTISFNFLGDGLQEAIDPKAIRR